MNVLHVIIIVLTVIVAILLIGIVLIQKSKGGGLSSQFGGANSVIGVRQANNFLEKGTWWLAGIIVVLSILSAYTLPTHSGTAIRSEQQQAAPAGAANQFGAPEAAPVAPAATPAEAAAPAEGE